MISDADQAALIDDPRVLRIAITDNGEPLVDLSSIPALAVEHARTDVQQLSDNPFQVRAGVAGRLARGQARLPDGYQFQIKEGWRPAPGEPSMSCYSRMAASWTWDGDSTGPATGPAQPPR